MNSVVIVAGGSGTRMMSELPKQFIEVHAKPIIVWTIEKFKAFDSAIRIVIVIPEVHVGIWDGICERYPDLKEIEIVYGGDTRYDSVLNGLSKIGDDDIVGIHDAVRPMVSVETIERCYKEAIRNDSAVPVVDSEDSLRQETEIGSLVLDRNRVKRVQTPQVFRSAKLKTAYSLKQNVEFTDDASVFEACFGTVSLVRGNRENMKVTYEMDLKVAGVILGLGESGE